MKPPQILGQLIYFFGYPIVLLAIYGSRRSYVAITCDDEILLTVDWLSFRHQSRLPGGGVKHNESPDRAAQREVLEEIGLTIDLGQLEALNISPIRSNKNFSYYIYRLRLQEKPTLTTKSLDVLRAEWVKRQDVNKYLLGEEAGATLVAMGWL